MGAVIMFKTTNVSPLDLHLDEKNPRFRVNVNPSQEDIRKYMLKHEKLLVLANSMTKMNTLLPGERVIIYNDGQRNIVLEGNRRTSIYQMFLERGLIPSEYQSSFPIASKEFLSEISNIPVDVIDNRQEAMAYLAARHIIGVEKWSSVSKWKVSYEYYNDGYSINDISARLVMPANKVRDSICKYKVLLRGIDSPVWTAEEKERLSPLDIKPDRLIRILHLSETRERLGLRYSEDYNLVSDKFSEEIITNLIVLLTRMAYITGDINTRTLIIDIWGRIISAIPELDVSSSRDLSSSTSSSYADGVVSCTVNTSSTNSRESEGDSKNTRTGGKGNLPYFFDGLEFSHLDRNKTVTHGILRVCEEIRKFSNRKLVKEFPIAAAFLTRSLIEQSFIYYSKTHKIQAQNKLIWDQICPADRDLKLSEIVNAYKRNLPNFILKEKIRDYFSALFENYNTTANPLNWVIHRPDEFVMNTNMLIELPGHGLLCLINFLIE